MVRAARVAVRRVTVVAQVNRAMLSSASSLYAAIDLGSNSFHMLVVREVAGSIQTVARIKRKVRLAAGLNDDNSLSEEAMERGWQCLRLFAERLQDIPHAQTRAVATATLRIATNADVFIAKAEEILGCPVQVISGEEEARLIYQGVAHTTGGDDRRTVVDIGGASTELVTGTGAQTTSLNSLSMGCVTANATSLTAILTRGPLRCRRAGRARCTAPGGRRTSPPRLEGLRRRLGHGAGAAGDHDGAGDG